MKKKIGIITNIKSSPLINSKEQCNIDLVSGISIEELKRLKEVYKERKESNGKATAYKEAADDEIREGVIDHLLALINYR